MPETIKEYQIINKQLNPIFFWLFKTNSNIMPF